MTYTRVRNQELSITFKPISSSSNTLFSHSNELFKDIEELLKKNIQMNFLLNLKKRLE